MKQKSNKKIAIVKISKNHQQENKKEKRYWEENTIRKPERKIITNNIQRKGVDLVEEQKEKKKSDKEIVVCR